MSAESVGVGSSFTLASLCIELVSLYCVTPGLWRYLGINIVINIDQDCDEENVIHTMPCIITSH